MSKILFLDTETTGLNSKEAAIIELAAIAVVDGKTMETFHVKLQPHAAAHIDDKALAVNGVRRDELFSSTRLPFTLAQARFRDFLSKYVDRYNNKDKFFFSAYNASFDEGFVEELFKRSGDKYFGSFFWRPPRCIYALAGFVLQDEWARMSNHKLGTVADYLGVKVPDGLDGGLHSALYDTTLARLIYDNLCARLGRMEG